MTIFQQLTVPPCIKRFARVVPVIRLLPAECPVYAPDPFFANALIMETGGPISLGSVVAREYGVPAVAGVVNATSQLQEGQMVRVNGETGSVEILDGS